MIRPEVRRCDTGICVWGDSFTELVTRLCANTRRNLRIIDDVVQAVQDGRRPLVLSDRVDHVEELAELLTDAGIVVELIHGGLGTATRGEIRARLDAGGLEVLVATASLIGEGFDCPGLDTLFLATPLSGQGRIVQYVGRVARATEGKSTASVVDYTDDHPMLWASWGKRREAYEALGLPIIYQRCLTRTPA